MGFHPKDLPVCRTFDLKDEKDASDATESMIKTGFKKEGFRVLMPKEPRLAKRMGHMITTGVTHGLRQAGQVRDVRYWTYHHDDRHYALVLISNSALQELGF